MSYAETEIGDAQSLFPEGCFDSEIEAINAARIKRMTRRISLVRKIKGTDYAIVDVMMQDKEEKRVVTDKKTRESIKAGSQKFAKMVQKRKRSGKV